MGLDDQQQEALIVRKQGQARGSNRKRHVRPRRAPWVRNGAEAIVFAQGAAMSTRIIFVYSPTTGRCFIAAAWFDLTARVSQSMHAVNRCDYSSTAVRVVIPMMKSLWAGALCPGLPQQWPAIASITCRCVHRRPRAESTNRSFLDRVYGRLLEVIERRPA